MLSFQSVLVYYNTLTHKPHALNQAARIARQTGAKVKVMDVVDESSPLLRKLLSNGIKLEKQAESERRARLEKAVASLRRSGAEAESVLAHGKPFVEIIREAIRGEHDLVLKTAEPDGTTRLFGTTAIHLMRKCPCPVWIVKPAGQVDGARILAAVDPIAAGAETEDLNRKIMEVARTLTVLAGGELHVAHAWRLPFEKSLLGSSRIPKERLASYTKQTRESARDSLYEFVDRFEFRVPRRRIHLLRGEPGAVIPRFVESSGFSVIVMGTVGRAGLKGILIGNTAERILGRVECSVVTLKPQGFVSPVGEDADRGQ